MKTNSRHPIMDRPVAFKTKMKRCIGLAGLSLATIVGSSNLAAAAGPTITLPSDLACRGFDLGIYIVTNEKRKPVNEFHDEHGNIVRTISTGKGDDLTFQNITTGATLHLKPNGSNQKSTLNLDGTTTWTNTGHNVLIMFPTDVPAGPSTILYTGKMIYTVAPPDNTFFFEGSSGKQVDICAALSG